jgi:DNA-binding transcriptional LysR family regulator
MWQLVYGKLGIPVALIGDCRDALIASRWLAMLLQIRSFLAVLEEGSLHRAATRLHISQSALSRQMQALEHELGGQLLDRSSTGVQPTHGGRALAERMGKFLTSYDANLLAVRRIIRGDAGELRIGYLASAFHQYLEPAVEKFRSLSPETKVKLLDQFPGEQIDALRQGSIDLAFIQGNRNVFGKEFHTRRIAEIESFVSLPDGHFLASRNQVKLADLTNETFIVGPENQIPGVRRRLIQLCRSYGKFAPKVIETPGGLSDAFSAIANDGAVAVIPSFLRNQKRPGMVILPISDVGATWDLVIAWQKGHTSEPLRALLASLPSCDGSD